VRALEWARRHDRNLAALRRAGRAAIVMPLAFFLGVEVIGNDTLGLFAAFGGFSMLLLADFTGPMAQRLQGQVALGIAGGVLVALGTLASAHPWLAAVGMVCVGLPILFGGVVSSILVGATPALLLSYVLPACLPDSASGIPERAAGWGLAAALCLLATALLWPTPASDPLREPAARSMELMARRVRTDVAFAAGGPDAPTLEDREQAVETSDAAVIELRQTFLASPYRPTGLNTADRTVVRLVDELEWLGQVVRHGRPTTTVPHYIDPVVVAVKLAAADVLEESAQVLHDPGGGRRDLDGRLDTLHTAVAALDDHLATTWPEDDDGGAVKEVTLTALDPAFRTQELAFATRQLAGNVALTSAAWRRSWFERVLGRQPAGIPTRTAAAVERGSAHLRLGSVWLHNSVRGALGLALAVYIADQAGVQHAFWVVLGALSVLRSNALSTGQNALRGLLGTTAGFVVGGLLVYLIGSNTALLWVLFPIAVLIAGFLPAAISFAAGQAAFTVVVMILFNLFQPADWQVGVVRVEDVALGCGVSLLVGLLFWPRGAGSKLRRAISDAYGASVRYLDAAVAYGMSRCRPDEEATPPPEADALAAAASSRRLDDAYRTYLAERGAKPSSLANVTGLVNGVVAVRLAAEAVVDLWQRVSVTPVPSQASMARQEIDAASHRLVGWYDALARGLVGGRPIPEPLEDSAAADDLTRALRADLAGDDPGRTATAVRMIWTHDYLDAIRRYQTSLVDPARVARRVAEERDARPLGWLR
jgi:uncharacterized membrane protein YccC